MRFTLEVELEGSQPFEVAVDSRDVRQWEAKFGESWLETSTSVTSLTQLAWLAARRTNQTALDWDEFDGGCVGLVRKDGEAPNPTLKAPGGAS